MNILIYILTGIVVALIAECFWRLVTVKPKTGMLITFCSLCKYPMNIKTAYTQEEYNPTGVRLIQRTFTCRSCMAKKVEHKNE